MTVPQPMDPTAETGESEYSWGPGQMPDPAKTGYEPTQFNELLAYRRTNPSGDDGTEIASYDSQIGG